MRSANANVTYLPCRVSGSTLTAVERSQLLVRWPGTHSRISSGIPRAAQTVLGVYLKRTCSRVNSASSALGVLNDYALYKSTHSLTHSLTPLSLFTIILTLHKYLCVFLWHKSILVLFGITRRFVSMRYSVDSSGVVSQFDDVELHPFRLRLRLLCTFFTRRPGHHSKRKGAFTRGHDWARVHALVWTAALEYMCQELTEH